DVERVKKHLPSQKEHENVIQLHKASLILFSLQIIHYTRSLENYSGYNLLKRAWDSFNCIFN
ncbi:hypothetical protein, partial [Aquiflexum sp.]|uniref:hypothetical protein n=1 Tax=Aquiflexum sp. TaxID=1872584 RepID=UPI003593A4B5